jgi:hypothetical protein
MRGTRLRLELSRERRARREPDFVWFLIFSGNTGSQANPRARSVIANHTRKRGWVSRVGCPGSVEDLLSNLHNFGRIKPLPNLSAHYVEFHAIA